MWRVGLRYLHLGRNGLGRNSMRRNDSLRDDLLRLGRQRTGRYSQRKVLSSLLHGAKDEKSKRLLLLRDYASMGLGAYLIIRVASIAIALATVIVVGQEKIEDWEMKLSERLGHKLKRENTVAHKESETALFSFMKEFDISLGVERAYGKYVQIPLTLVAMAVFAQPIGVLWGVGTFVRAADKANLAKNVTRAAKSDSTKKKATKFAQSRRDIRNRSHRRPSQKSDEKSDKGT